MKFVKGFKRSEESKKKQREKWAQKRLERDKEREEERNKTIKSSSNILKEININKEFKNMSEQVNPKPKASEEEKYECGECHKKFNEKYTHCPHCGVEFQ